MRRYPKIGDVALACALLAAPAMAKADPRLTQDAAEQALDAGDPATAAALAQEILTAAPDSFAGLMLLALAQSDLGDMAGAAAAGQLAYRTAPDAATKLQAARLTAAAHFQQGQFARAEIWLRRASNHAQTPDEADTVARDYRSAAQANPLSIRTTASIAPSSNINNGSVDGILTFEGIDLQLQLPEDQRALSGIAYAGSVRLGYRLSQDAVQTTTAGLLFSGATYSLSRDARALLDASPIPRVQGLTGHDFRSFRAEAGLTHTRGDLSPLGPVSATLDVGGYWEGGVHLVNYHVLMLQQGIPYGPDRRFILTGSTQWQHAVSASVVDAVVHDLSATYDLRLANRDQMQLTLAARHRDGGFENIYDEYRAGVGYAFEQPVLGTRLSTGVEIGYRHYDTFPTTLDGRRDRFASVTGTAVLDRFTTFGFAPTLTAKATRTLSTADEYTTSVVEIGIGIQSTF
ncbi:MULTISPECIES: hypothetical protein [unclassified Yoonia]|uniref:tetratricopeptide repeat protein n=1 Tax=unclassified Yoonia TaxID=2629118 RepID=UPI002AFED239|nr:MULTISPECIES: hypothetical protein [unclassified Yoonia]